ncbi:MAG: RdgB/HAM1 family non-canonical purine NTP pyrophosphatase [Desulfarculales bacterium]|jgi:XTP/dITP diphosphohydrolase|nr:RdgB/HAM1 family non-canonical purine NTP pyrophosphatase [Desulfarculales bacterium]
MTPLLILASGNKAKLQEIKALLTPFAAEVKTAAEMGFRAEIVENGRTFTENAHLKARAVAAALNLPALADDSGLAVECLGGRPGLLSARYCGVGANDHDNNRKLLREMAGQENRAACFVCALACAQPDGSSIEAQGTLRGLISTDIRGEHGFGYDPLFLLPELGLTLAQIDGEIKNRLSHRGRALRLIMRKLPEFIGLPPAGA